VGVYSEFLFAIYEQFGRWPVERTVIEVGDGKEHGASFRQTTHNLLVPGSLTDTLPITIKINKAYCVNDGAVVEGPNGVFHRLAKRYAENTKGRRNPRINYLSYWYGQGGVILRELNFLMNTRPVSSLGYQTPAHVLEAWLQTGDDAVVSKAKKSKIGMACARRGAAHITKLPVGAKVRRISLKYLKEAGSRGNIMKQAPAWSKDLYMVTSRRGEGCSQSAKPSCA
jgi:hypothetical protein